MAKKWQCTACGYIYDPEVGDPDSGVAPGTAFEDIPDDWVCPVCGVGKDMFEPLEQPPLYNWYRKWKPNIMGKQCELDELVQR